MLSFPRGTEMFQFPRCPPRILCIQMRVTRVHLVGFPHSDMSGSTLATSSPDLFAGDRVLHRPLAPRHPPRALCSLTYFQHPARPSRAGGCRSSSCAVVDQRTRCDRVRFAIGETRGSRSAHADAILHLLSSSSVVKVHCSLGRAHAARGQARENRASDVAPP